MSSILESRKITTNNNTNDNNNNTILMFRSQKMEYKKERWPQTYIFEEWDDIKKQYHSKYHRETTTYYEREKDNAIINVTEVLTVPSHENIDKCVKNHISKSFHNDLEFLGIARRYVPNFEINKGV